MKLFLIDGHALIFKMYYAFLGRPMINGKGVDTSILFGFTKYLLELIEREHPTHLAVSFDPPGGTFRNVMYPAYKANRVETPQLVIDALEPLTAIVKAMDIPVLMIPGFEADDVIGSMAKRCAGPDMDVYMVTPDKDYGQLIEEHIFQYRPGKAGGENEILGIPEVCGKWGIERPEQVIDILALCGDTADNVPGVQGVGPVGAAKLLAKYGTMEGIYEHIGELTARQQTLFEAARDHIGLSKELVTIKTDIELETSVRDMVFNPKLTPELSALFDLYEFNSLKRHIAKFEAEGPAVPESASSKVKIVPVKLSAEEFIAKVSPEDGIAILSNPDASAVTLACGCNVTSGSPELFSGLLESAAFPKIGADLKTTINALARRGIALAGALKDVELMHYLLNPERSHKLDYLASTYLGLDINDPALRQVSATPDYLTPCTPCQGDLSPLRGPHGTQAETASVREFSLFDEPEDDAVKEEDRSLEAAALWHLGGAIASELESVPEAKRLYDDIEEPLVMVLSRMELAGVKVDMASLREYANALRNDMLASEAKVRELAGVPALNVSSPKQIGEVIFEKLKLDPAAKKPRSGNWPTDEQTLSELSDRSPIIDAILDYRGQRKLLSTYIEPFPGYISPVDGRVHTTFNQALTSTGRLSSSNPNLQNIPIRTEEGRLIRKAFVAEPGCVIMSADYSQIELRIMAHLCGDEHLCAAFRAGTDVHAATAAKIYGIPVGDVTADQRRVAKTANFGIMYGISSFGLSQRLKCSRSEAKKIIDDYFESFPSIRSFIDGTLASARANGYVETLFGRRRYVPDVNSHNGNIRSLAERNAVNAPIQGTSADIIKLAMVGVDRRLREDGLKTRMVLQIHDELLLEVPETEIEKVRDILVSEMEGVIALNVPLTVECNYGKTWLDAH